MLDCIWGNKIKYSPEKKKSVHLAKKKLELRALEWVFNSYFTGVVHFEKYNPAHVVKLEQFQYIVFVSASD